MKKVLLIVLSVVILGVIWKQDLIFRRRGQTKQDKPYFQTTNLPFNQLPPGFMADVYVPKNAVLIGNSSTELPDGRTWVTRNYETALSLAVLRDEYERYLKTFGSNWTKPNVHQTKENNFILSTQGDKKLLIIALSKSKTTNLIKITFADTK